MKKGIKEPSTDQGQDSFSICIKGNYKIEGPSPRLRSDRVK